MRQDALDKYYKGQLKEFIRNDIETINKGQYQDYNTEQHFVSNTNRFFKQLNQSEPEYTPLDESLLTSLETSIDVKDKEISLLSNEAKLFAKKINDMKGLPKDFKRKLIEQGVKQIFLNSLNQNNNNTSIVADPTELPKTGEILKPNIDEQTTNIESNDPTALMENAVENTGVNDKGNDMIEEKTPVKRNTFAAQLGLGKKHDILSGNYMKSFKELVKKIKASNPEAISEIEKSTTSGMKLLQRYKQQFKDENKLQKLSDEMFHKLLIDELMIPSSASSSNDIKEPLQGRISFPIRKK